MSSGATRVAVVMTMVAAGRARGEEGEHSAFVDDDPGRPDERYFANVDRVIGIAEDLGL
jgi:hypothetical protein